MFEKAPRITNGMIICDTYRKMLSNEFMSVTEPVTFEIGPPTPSLIKL